MNLIEVLSSQRKGKCLVEAEEKLQAVVAQCQKTGLAGSMTITFKLKPGLEEGTIHVSDDVDAKLPKAAKPSVTYYSDAQGALHRDDPKQGEFSNVVDAAENFSG